MESYLLKCSLSLIVLYGLYRITIRFEFNHQLNRFVGLACVIFSAIFPFVQLPGLTPATPVSTTFYFVSTGVSGLQSTFSSVVTDDTVNIVLLIYSVGASVFLLRYLSGLATLCVFYFTSPKTRHSGFTVVRLGRNMSPFTFFNVLFIGRTHLDDADMEVMLLHERVHRDQYHSIDTLFLEALTVLFWFNPAMWFFQRDIKAEHEYFADKRVLERGFDPIAYQLLLFKVRTGAAMKMGSYLSKKTSLTKRFNMMTKTGSKPMAKGFRVSLFLFMMSALFVFSSFYGYEESQVDSIARYPQGEEAMYQDIKKRIKYPASARREKRSGSVNVTFTVDENGNLQNVRTRSAPEGHIFSEIVVVGYFKSQEKEKGIDKVLETEAVRVVESLGEFIPAEKDGKPVRSVLTLPIKFVLN